MSYESYQRFAQAKAEGFDLIERERREFDEFNARMHDYKRHHGSNTDRDVVYKSHNSQEDRVAAAARNDAKWHEWFNAKFKQCLIDEIDDEKSFLHGIFAETISLLRAEIDQLAAEIRTLKGVARGEVAMIRKKDDDAAA